MFWCTVLQIVLGALIGIGFIIWMEFIRQPRLKLTIKNPEELNFPNNFPVQRLRSLRLSVSNSNLPCLLRWLLRLPAQRCSGIVSFHALNGQNLFGRTWHIRWINSPEPLPIRATIGNQQLVIFDPVRLTPELHRDVFPGTEEIFDIAARFDLDVDCFGWSNENYFSNPLWRNPNSRIMKGQFFIKVEIQSSGKKCIGTFRLFNDATIDEFHFESTIPSVPLV